MYCKHLFKNSESEGEDEEIEDEDSESDEPPPLSTPQEFDLKIQSQPRKKSFINGENRQTKTTKES